MFAKIGVTGRKIYDKPLERPGISRNIVSVLFIQGVMSKHQRKLKRMGQPQHSPSDQERMLGMNDIESEFFNGLGEKSRNRQNKGLNRASHTADMGGKGIGHHENVHLRKSLTADRRFYPAHRDSEDISCNQYDCHISGKHALY